MMAPNSRLPRRVWMNQRPFAPSKNGHGKRNFESAQTNRLNAKHWQKAGGEDLDTLLLPTLETMRNRCLHEVRNGEHAKGIIGTYATDLVGIDGPVLQVGMDNDDLNTEIEYDWQQWQAVCDAGGRQHFVDMLKSQAPLLWTCGEFFIQKLSKPDGKHPVQLRLLPIHPARVQTPIGVGSDPLVKNGVRVDEDGAPVSYFVLSQHPGAAYIQRSNTFSEVPASDMYHVYVVEEPGQTRGIPWLQTALRTIANLRDFDDATILAARAAAMLAVMVYTTHAEAQFSQLSDLPVMDLEALSLMTLPEGWQAMQVKPEHPANTHKEYRHDKLADMGRPKGMPYLKVACDASSHNYSSARLDLQNYWREIASDQAWLTRCLMSSLFDIWYAERRMISGGPLRNTFSIDWFWDGIPAIDEAKEEDAVTKRLANGTTSLQIEAKKRGLDWRKLMTQQKREQDFAESIGLVRDPVPYPAPDPSTGDENAQTQ